MHRTYELLYRIGIAPWSSDRIPAPVRDLAEELPAGIAVDLGCGTGAQACALAERGWSVTGVDFVAGAVAQARQRRGADLVRWRVADVTDPAAVDPDRDLAGRVSLVLDNGCAHGISDAQRPAWAATVRYLAGPGAHLLVRAAPRGRRPIGPKGLDGAELGQLLGPGWESLEAPAAGWFHHGRIGPA
jgi:SAM-dependent methyltransferase